MVLEAYVVALYIKGVVPFYDVPYPLGLIV